MIDQTKLLANAAIKQLRDAENNLSKLPDGSQKDYLTKVIADLKVGKTIDANKFIEKIKSLNNAN